jgi:aminobenzoyl-glutamate utilization protein B
MRLLLIASALASLCCAEIDRARMLRVMDDELPQFAKLSREIWELAELGFAEHKSSKLLQQVLRGAGFQVKAGVAGMPTAFIASWGNGQPVIAILGEYDALPGLSQDSVPERKPLVQGAGGHGCGHNLFGTAAAHAAIAAKRLMEANQIGGTIRFYGTPAEENGGGKIFMIRAGLFKDVDAAITWHPSSVNAASNQNWLAAGRMKFEFTGKASHAAMAPDQGRSALDAAVLMTHAVDLLREHVPQETRIHYVIGNVPTPVNVVLSKAEVTLMARHPDSRVLDGIWQRILLCAEAGALATETQLAHSVAISYANMIPNRAIAGALDRNMRLAGPYTYTPDERAFAEAIQKTLAGDAPPVESANRIQAPLDSLVSASTDVGDVSYVVPTAQFGTATFVPGTALHTWQSTAAAGMTIGQKGMLLAAKTLALTALDLLTDAKLLSAAKQEFAAATGGRAYTSRHPEKPPVQ